MVSHDDLKWIIPNKIVTVWSELENIIYLYLQRKALIIQGHKIILKIIACENENKCEEESNISSLLVEFINDCYQKKI